MIPGHRATRGLSAAAVLVALPVAAVRCDGAGEPVEAGSEEARAEASRPPGDGRVADSGSVACRGDSETSRGPDVVCIESIRGRYVDEEDSAVEGGLLVTVCGPRECTPGRTDDSGAFEIPVGLYLNPSDYAVLAHGRPGRAAFYHALPAGPLGRTIDLGTLRLLRLPLEGPQLSVDAEATQAQTVTSGDVTLEVPSGVRVRLDVESILLGQEGRGFRARSVPRALFDDFVPGVSGIDALFAFEPFEARFEHGATGEAARVRLVFDNNGSLAAGTLVEVLALGSYVYPDWVRPATFSKVADARVSTDAARIELEPGEGVLYLTWLALRPAGP